MIVLIPLFLSLACSDPGWIRGPVGGMPARTATYRIGVRDNRPELLLLLSTSLYESCSLPNIADPEADAGLRESVLLATCREGAQHVLIQAYSEDDGWAGTYTSDTSARPRDIGITTSRYVRGRYYGVEEAFLVRFDELIQGYAATRATSLSPLPDGGVVTLEETGGGLRGTFDFGEVAGEFDAEPCIGDTSLLDRVDEDWSDTLCEF